MKSKEIVIKCMFSENELNVAEIMKESFRIFLKKELYVFDFERSNSIY